MFSSKALPLFSLLLSAPLAAAEDVRLADDRVLETGLKEARLISELNGYAIVAGRSCVDCDENTSIYIQKIADGGAGEITGEDRYTYPGRYVDYLSKEPVEKTRLFYGSCYENQPALLWLSEYREETGWSKSEYLIVFTEEGPQHRYNENRQPSIHYIKSNGCVELPGITAETEP